MDELRAAVAIARKDIRNVSRYRFQVASSIFTPLYQGILPALLFGASFAVAGRVVGLERTIGTADLAGFIFLGGVMTGLVATAFWSMAMSIRNEMEAGTLEPTNASWAAMRPPPMTTFAQTTPRSVDGTVARTAIWTATPAATIQA